MTANPWNRKLPTGKQISALGFGCASVWASSAFSDWRNVYEAAREGGVTHFDTSPSYGMTTAEKRLGELLRSENRGSLVISSKVGSNVLDGQMVKSYDPEIMERSLSESLSRLGTDHLDILYLHGPGPQVLNDETFAFFDQMKASGRIALSGVNSFARDTLERLILTPIDVVMLQFNIEDQSCADLVDRLSDAGKVVISGTALARGKFRPSSFIPRDRASLWYLARMTYHDPNFLLNGHRLRQRMRKVAKPATVTAIQFVTGHPAITSTLFGTRNPDHAIENARAGHGALSGSEIAVLRWQNRL